MTAVDQPSPQISFRRRVRDARIATRRVYAPLTHGWADTKQAYGAWSERTKQRFAAAPPLVRTLFVLVPLVLVLALPQMPFVSAFYKTALVDRVAFYVLLALGLNIVVGYAGLLDLGYVAFYAIGAYVAAYWTGVAPIAPPFQLDPFMTFPFAIVTAMLAGVLLGLPTLRLRGDYLAIVTLGFHEIVRLTLKNADPFTNGDRGLRNIPHFAIPAAEGANYVVVTAVLGVLVLALGAAIVWRAGREARTLGISVAGVGLVLAALSPVLGPRLEGFGQRFADFGLDPVPYYYLAVVICGIMIVIVRRLSDSRIGRGWVAIREDEIAAEAMGVPTLKYKVWAFALGASTAGFAGVMLAIKTSFINPQYFLLLQSIIVLAMVVFGGMGSITGAVAGAIFIGFTQEALRDFDVVPFGSIFGFVAVVLALFGVLIAANVIRTRAGKAYGFWLLGIGAVIALATATGLLQRPFVRIAEAPENWRLFILGLILMVVMITRPQGLFPSKRRAAELHGETVASSEALMTSETTEAETDEQITWGDR